MENNIEALKAGDKHYKAYVGPPNKYDLVGAMQFNLLTNFGLRDVHKLLDIGCGSLRSGKLLISYLREGNYYGIEPNNWLIEEGIKNETGQDLINIKKPNFINSEKFELNKFNEEFDFLIAQSIFSHATENQIRTCLTEAKKVLKPKGLFLATFVLGDTNYKGDTWVYPGCVTYTEDYIKTLIKNQKLSAVKLNSIHPNNQTWFVIYHPNNNENILNIIKSLPKVPQKKKLIKQKLKKYKLFNNSISRYINKLIKKDIFI